jgi:hypothetical protein
MLDFREEEQALIKYFIENPKEINSFQKSPEAVFEKLGINLYDRMVSRVVSVVKDVERLIVNGKAHSEHSKESHSKHSKSSLDDIDLSKYVVNPRVHDLIKHLAANNNDFIVFNKNPNALFSEYGIEPNQEFAKQIIDSLNFIMN